MCGLYLFECGSFAVNYVFRLGKERPYTVEEAACAVNACVTPRLGNLERTHEHLVETEGICAVISYNVGGVNYEFGESLTHLDAVCTENHTLVNQLLEGLLSGSETLIVEVPVTPC